MVQVQPDKARGRVEVVAWAKAAAGWVKAAGADRWADSVPEQVGNVFALNVGRRSHTTAVFPVC